MIRIGVIGTGGMAQQRVNLFHARPDTAVVGVCSRSQEKTRQICDLTDATGYDDIDVMLAKIDAVVICTPNVYHAPLARKALASGVHTLVEYPVSISYDEATTLQDAAHSAGVVLMTGNTIIREAMFGFLHRRVDRLGPLLSATSRVAFYSHDIGDTWYMQPSLTGPVFAAFHYHHIEYYRRFFGEVEWVMAHDEGSLDADRSGFMATAGGTLTMGHVTGATSCIQWYLSASGSGLPRGMWINGTRGSVSVMSHGGDDAQSLVTWDNGGPGKTETFDNEWGVAGSCEDFVLAMAGELDHRQRLASDLITLQVGLAATESSKTRALVPLKDFAREV